MPTVEQLRSRLLKKLTELFQLDQPDLDFGFYRIMHAKSQEVQEFISIDLLKIVEEAFGDADEVRKKELKANIEKEIQAARDYGVADPENSPKVMEARVAYDAVKEMAGAEAEVYDHLYRFFERYYDAGDFISRRYYTRETPGKAAPFAVPYNGEEVKLHWANADQYYIKSAEYFSNYTFDLRHADEVQALRKKEEAGLFVAESESPLKVHFRIVEASEGEHGNVKASEATKRFFILHDDNPVVLNESGELVINFEYRPDPEKTGPENTWRDKRNAEAVQRIQDRLQMLVVHGGEQAERASEYLRMLKIPAGTESDKNRILLAKYLYQYTARNTMDYFIHKDLGGFLRRELDFYIKNEVMRLDDIENAEAPAVESYLAKIKVLRRIAGKLIDFLAQLEDFQKKLWLKKKFVVETNYCITLDRVPEELYPDVAANEAQCDEWIKLFAIDEIQESAGDLIESGTPGFSRPLKIEFLKANNKLVLDTRFFDDSFNARLIASIENFDEECDGLLIHSENFQALTLIKERYQKQSMATYIDPPYNTGKDGFVYKDVYQHSSWLSMAFDRIAKGQAFAADEAAIFAAIDEGEQPNFRKLFDATWGAENFIADMVWAAGRKNDSRLISVSHEYMLVYANNKSLLSEKKIEWRQKKKGLGDIYTQHKKLKKEHGEDYVAMTEGLKAWFNDLADGHPSKAHKHYSFVDRRGVYFPADISWPGGGGPKYEVLHPVTKKPVKMPKRGWMTPDQEKMEQWIKDDLVHFGEDENSVPCIKAYLMDREYQAPYSVFYQDGRAATKRLRHILGADDFGYPKDEIVVAESIAMLCGPNDLALDYFAGSGTTAHAVINLNREDGGKRKYILVEMGDYFDTVLKPRIAKVAYSESWKDGKPAARTSGISHCFKYIRLESYEDTLNNLRFDDNPQRQKSVAASPSLKEDYMLHYLLDVETRGSQSLLNIDAFADPTAYILKVKKPGTDQYIIRPVDLIETFNYLIGLRVEHSSVPQTFQATFKRIADPELPEDQHTKLVLDGKMKQVNEQSTIGKKQDTSVSTDHCSLSADHCFWFRKVEGWVPKDSANPNNGQREKVLIVWRKLTGNIEEDNLMLDEWFQKNRISTRDFEFDTIYVNGSNNLPNLKLDGDNWEVRLIEEEFMKRMWEVEG